MQNMGGHALFRDMARRNEERKAWEAQHPAIAADWNAALEEDYRRTEAAERQREEEARRHHLRQTAPDRLVRMGAPRRAVDVWDAGAAETRAMLAIQDAMRRGKTFVLLSGDRGVGKTVAAVAAMASRLLEGRREDLPCLFVRAEECQGLGLYDAADKKLVAQMRDAGVLVLDDLGTEFLSKGSIWQTILDGVIDVRYGDSAFTVITTNLTFAVFKERYGARIEDRIGHAGVAVDLGTGSLRKRGEG